VKPALTDAGRQSNIEVVLGKFIDPSKSTPDDLTMAVLRLLLNLSFDTEIRSNLVQQGFIPKCVELLKRSQFRHIALKLLYHISMDDKCKSMFTYTDCLPMVVNMVQNFPEQQVEKTLIALAVNLASNARNAEAMTEGDRLGAFLSRLFQTKDPLLAKMLRNLSSHDGQLKMRFAEFISDIAALARQTDAPDLLVELLGILGNMTMTEIPFAQVAPSLRPALARPARHGSPVADGVGAEPYHRTAVSYHPTAEPYHLTRSSRTTTSSPSSRPTSRRCLPACPPPCPPACRRTAAR
jgi:hypothetical protein